MSPLILNYLRERFGEKMNQLTQKEITEMINSVKKNFVNPLTPMSDQNRVSPYNINTISARKVTRIYMKILSSDFS